MRTPFSYLAAVLLVSLASPLAAQSLTEREAATPSHIAPDTPPTVLLVAQEQPELAAFRQSERIETETRFGIGLGGTFIAYGLSGTVDLGEAITAEAIVGILGALTSAGGRVWYRVLRTDAYDVYGYGSASFLRAGGTDENAIGLGAGAGVEVGLPQLLDNESFPPIFFNADLGFAFATFETYDFGSIAYGSGVHYRF